MNDNRDRPLLGGDSLAEIWSVSRSQPHNWPENENGAALMGTPAWPVLELTGGRLEGGTWAETGELGWSFLDHDVMTQNLHFVL